MKWLIAFFILGFVMLFTLCLADVENYDDPSDKEQGELWKRVMKK